MAKTTGEHLDRLGPAAVTAHRPQRAPFRAHHVGQGVRVGGVALTTRAAFSFPEPRDTNHHVGIHYHLQDSPSDSVLRWLQKRYNPRSPLDPPYPSDDQ